MIGAMASGTAVEQRWTPLMETVVEVTATDGPDKLVHFPLTGEPPVAMGMHGELAEHYKAAPGSFEPRASTLDYVIAGLAACLTGTFRRALSGRDVSFSPDDLKTRAVGKLEVNDHGVVVIRSVEVSYRLAGIPEAQRELAERAHRVHERGCPVSRSLEGAFEVTTTLEFV
jgi:uncharacterized OsmC-like protein